MKRNRQTNGFNEKDENLQHNFMHGTPDLNKLRVSQRVKQQQQQQHLQDGRTCTFEYTNVSCSERKNAAEKKIYI